MNNRHLQEELTDCLRPVTAPMALWAGIEENLNANLHRKPAPRRPAAWAIAAAVLVTMSASALWFLEAAPRRGYDPSVADQFRTARPLVCSNCHV
jgi:hypothetical protein